MIRSRFIATAGPGTLAAGALLFFLTIIAWLMLLRAPAMAMPAATPSAGEGIAFTLQWGIMMAAMMLPSATAMILLYRTVSQRLRGAGDKSIPPAAFMLVYLFVWLLIGVPVYAGYVLVGRFAQGSVPFNTALPYMIAATLFAAGTYQFTSVKRACLRKCETPLFFLMRRWRSGYGATFRIALDHAIYCVGCCWALMLILVVAGAMSLPWVLAIGLAVFAEKILPRRWRTAQVIGMVLIVLGGMIAMRPELARTLRGTHAPAGMTM